jgi:hypothetical protein
VCEGIAPPILRDELKALLDSTGTMLGTRERRARRAAPLARQSRAGDIPGLARRPRRDPRRGLTRVAHRLRGAELRRVLAHEMWHHWTVRLAGCAESMYAVVMGSPVRRPLTLCARLGLVFGALVCFGCASTPDPVNDPVAILRSLQRQWTASVPGAIESLGGRVVPMSVPARGGFENVAVLFSGLPVTVSEATYSETINGRAVSVTFAQGVYISTGTLKARLGSYRFLRMCPPPRNTLALEFDACAGSLCVYVGTTEDSDRNFLRRAVLYDDD